MNRQRRLTTLVLTAVLLTGIVTFVDSPSASAAGACSSSGFVCINWGAFQSHGLQNVSACVNVTAGTKQSGTMYIWVYDPSQSPAKIQAKQSMSIDRTVTTTLCKYTQTLTSASTNVSIAMFFVKEKPQVCANWYSNNQHKWFKQVCRYY